MSHSKPNNDSNLSQAIGQVDQAVYQNLVQNGDDVNIKIGGNTLLHWAVINSEENIVAMLLDKGADIYAKNNDNYTSLYLAIQNNKKEIASLLMKKGAIIGENLHPLLNMAINKNNDTIVKMIIDHGIQDNPSINLIIYLEAALSQRNSKMIETILPHCGFSKPSDIYIPKEFVINYHLLYQTCLEVLLKWNFIISPNNYHDEDLIYAAVEKGHVQIVEDLLEHEIDVNLVNSKTGLNLLTIACLNKHHEIIKKLLQHNAIVNVKISSTNEILYDDQPRFTRDMKEFRVLFPIDDPENNSIDITCLHIAVFNSDLISTDILLRCGVKIADDTELFNLTCYAVSNNYKEIVDLFLNHGVKVTDVSLDRKPLLHFCVLAEHDPDSNYDVAKLLLEKGANIYLYLSSNIFVFEAIINIHFEIASLFLDYNANVQYINSNGDSLLHKAIEYDCGLELIETLLKLGAPVNAKNVEGLTPIHLACALPIYNKFEVIETLLNYNADVNCIDDCLVTPLIIACGHGWVPIVHTLLNEGANVNAKDKEGKTPLHYSCKSWHDTATIEMQLLLKRGANIEAVDNRGWTPLSTACSLNNFTIIKFLLDHHANPNHTDFRNRTPLHLVIKRTFVRPTFYYPDKNSVQLLIKHGAKFDALDRKNRTPLHAAVKMMILYFRNDSQPSDFRKNCEVRIKTLVAQGIKLKTAGLKLNNHNSNINYNLDGYITIDNVRYSAIDILQLNVNSGLNEVVSNNSDSNEEDSIGDIQQLKFKCEQEIQKMKEKNIGIDDLTFYDLLECNFHVIGAFYENDEIQKNLETGVYDEEFPLYIDIIRNRLRDVKIHYEKCLLMVSAKQYFWSNIYERLLDECTDEILSYLNIEELKTFIEAMKLSNN